MPIFKRLFKKELFEKELLGTDSKSVSDKDRQQIYQEAEEHPKSIMTFQPHDFSEVQIISNHIIHKRSAIVDTERLDKKQTLKLINFLLGVIYTLDGSVKKLSPTIFLFAPKHIKISHKAQEVLQK